MIKIVKGDKTFKHSVSEYDDLVIKAKYVSNKSLFHFFELIGLDKKLFSHLKDIQIALDLDIDNDYEYMIAFYENINVDDHELDNTIHLLPEYLDSIFEKDTISAFNDLIKTLIHETIHANRSIMINNAVLYPECFLSSIREYEEYRSMFGHLIKKSNKKFQVLKVENNNSFYTVYAYSNQSGDFYVYSLSTRFNFDINSIEYIEKLLNNNINFFDFISQIENPYDMNPTSLVANYSTWYKNPLTLKRKEMKNVSNEVDKQTDFEESITEAFTRIIFYLLDKKEYNIDELLKDESLLPNVRLALQYINTLDMDTIRWFFLSCYDEEYRNKFYEMHKNDYFSLIDKISLAYRKSMDDEEYTGYDDCMKLIVKLKSNK